MNKPIPEGNSHGAPKQRITTFLSNLDGGGAERITVNLLKGFSPEVFDLELVLVEAKGPFLDQVPAYVRLIDLKAGGVSRAVVPFARHLRRSRPDVLMSHSSHVNVGAMIATQLSRIDTKVVLVEHNDRSSTDLGGPTKRKVKLSTLHRRLLPKLIRHYYRDADAIVGVSRGVSKFVEDYYLTPGKRAHTIYNPIIDDELRRKAQAPPEHPWLLDAGPPVLLAVGRLTRQKDFANLLRAFALVRCERDCRLIILGEGELRASLEALSQELGITEAVSLPGFANNPYAFMSRAAALVLSSQWEGLPTVLVEAMACGTPVVATDCPSGPDEILEGGRWGALAEVRNPGALAAAITSTLDAPLPAEQLQARAEAFSYDRAVAAYSELFKSL